MFLRGFATTVLVESLAARRTVDDLLCAQAATDRLAEMPTEPGLVLHGLPLLRLRALLAHARRDDIAYRDYRDRYRALATSLG
jgi:adenylate cyclase